MSKIHGPKSIKIKTFMYIMTVVAVILVLTYTLQIVGLQQIYELTKQNEVKTTQKEMLAELKTGDLHTSIDSIMSLSRHSDIFVEIYDSEKEIVMSPYMYMEERMWELQQHYPFRLRWKVFRHTLYMRL